ncbi:unnamed protein product [Oncorhynchus mykiss]|uniref:Uncharacterized protein n=1 Tax=Oncorhynchus mykiss TaxID=8022 RepID=A0A060XQF6_ONCMY|nr:unnamed protein product [Oncorhynchus mykiss]
MTQTRMNSISKPITAHITSIVKGNPSTRGIFSIKIHFLMILSANWAYLKDASRMHAYQDIKLKEEQELHDFTSRSKECLNSYT